MPGPQQGAAGQWGHPSPNRHEQPEKKKKTKTTTASATRPTRTLVQQGVGWSRIQLQPHALVQGRVSAVASVGPVASTTVVPTQQRLLD